MVHRHLIRVAALVYVSMAMGTLAWAAEKGEQSTESREKYIRVERNGADEPIALQTSIVRFVSEKPEQKDLVVDLVGAVHVGEKAYYDALNEAFEKYDVVLYELVAPAGTRVPKGGKPSGHPVSALQNGLKGILQLEHQLEHVDYMKDNLIHADMSPDDFSKSMENRGESFWTLFFRMMGQSMAQQAKYQSKGKSFDADLLLALFDPNQAVALKRVMAEQFEDLEGVMGALDGPDGSTIITERNKVALEGLKKQIDAGKKRVAIFYGAGHMPDMERRLISDFGLKRTSERWLTAWNLKTPEGARKAAGKK